MKALIAIASTLMMASAMGQLPPSALASKPQPATSTSATSAVPAAKPSVPEPPAEPVIPEYNFRAKVLSVWPEGALIECTRWSSRNPKETEAHQVLGKFFLRGHPGALYDDAQIRFWAKEDGTFSYNGLLGKRHTLRAIRFTRNDDKAIDTAPPPVSGMARIGGESSGLAPAKNSEKNPHAELRKKWGWGKSTNALDKPAERAR